MRYLRLLTIEIRKKCKGFIEEIAKFIKSEYPDMVDMLKPVIGRMLLLSTFTDMAGMFLLFFLLGYLLYGAMLSALAARLDSDADALQWALLTGLPLFAVLALLPVLLRAADGTLAVVLGLVPFTAPVAMLVRIPFGVPVWQVVISAVILLVTFAAVAVLASRVYRRNILPRQ